MGVQENGESELLSPFFRVTNEEVLKKVVENRCLFDKIRSRMRNWVGHVLRGKGLMCMVYRIEWREKELEVSQSRVCLMRF